MSATPEDLARYVPHFVRTRLAHACTSAPRAWAQSSRGVVLFADITGSTALAEKLGERGAAGAEELGSVLNEFFGTLIDVIDAHRGDLVKFAGDGLFAFWPSPPDRDLAEAAADAVRCGLAAQDAILTAGNRLRLSMRIGIGAGDVVGMVVGSPQTRLEFLLCGAPVAQACLSERRAEPGQLVVSDPVWALIEPLSTGVRLADGGAQLRAIRPPDEENPRRRDEHAPADSLSIEALLPFTPPATRAQLDAGHGRWLAELRPITAVFVQLPQSIEGAADEVSAVIETIESVLGRYEGTLSRIGMDERGPVVKAAFGLPPYAHEDDPFRATQAALEIRDRLLERGLSTSIGLATGRAFCGEVGTSHRSEYTTVGEVVHRAARLMQNAVDGILCDAATHAACTGRIDFDAPRQLALKGVSDVVRAYPPRRRASSARRATGPLLGRDQERARITACVDALLAGGPTRALIVEGEAGMGKSRLVEELCRQAEAHGLRTLIGSGDAIERTTPYHSWRPILSELLALDEGGGAARAKLAALALVPLAPGGDPSRSGSVADLLPLLNAALGLELADTDFTARLSGEARGDATSDLIVRLLQLEANEHAMLVVLEDAHWLDSASWAVAELMVARLPHLLTVVATRPVTAPAAPAYLRLQDSPHAEHLRLGLLDATEAASLAAHRFGVDRVSEQILAFIHERAGGHPYFTEELANALRDSQIVHIDTGECRVAPAAGNLNDLSLPTTIEATLTGRMDLLTARQQMLLKVASVFGRSFSVAALREVHPIEVDRPHLEGDLADLEETDLVHRAPDNPDLYVFKHAITRDVAYDRMAFAQRRQLHAAVAEWYERAHAADLAPYHPLLAHHWSRAFDPATGEAAIGARAIAALESAGEQAVRSYANAEAEVFFGEALRVHEALGDGIDATGSRRARWHRHLADAKNRLGKIPQAIGHAHHALTYLDRPFPESNARRYAGIARELVRHAGHRLRSRRTARLDGRARSEALEAAHLYELLGLMWYITLDGVPSMLANLRALNLAERAGPSSELATSCAMVGLSAGVLLGPRFSEHYFAHGEDAAKRAGDRYGYGRICFTRALVYSGDARWDESYAAFAEAQRTFEEIGEVRWRDITASMVGSTTWLRRRYREARRIYESAAKSPQERGDVQAQAWLNVGRAITLVAEGRLQEGLEEFDRFESWLSRNFDLLADRGALLIMYAMRAIAHVRLGNPDLAMASIAENLRLVREAPALTYYVLGGYTYTLEACLRLWESGAVPQRQIAPLARQAMRNLRRYGRLYRLARPSLALWRGTMAWLRGRPRRARSLWLATIPLARAQDMPLEEGLAHFEIARHLGAGDPEREHHLRRAREIFAEFGYAYELSQAERT